jgi:hypothetical protein
MNNKQTNTSNNGNLSDGTLLARTVRYSGKYLTEVRSNPGEESQRKTAVNIIKNNANDIKKAAAKYRVTPEAIAVAIAWEGAENNDRPAGTPGRVHGSTARSIYNIDKKIPRDYTPDRIGEPKVAIEYIGAIMRDNANVYKNNSGIDISKNTPLLADLYQSGIAAKLGKQIAKGREEDRKAGRPLREPRIAKDVNGMGEYAENGANFSAITQWLGTSKDIYGPHGMNQSPNDSFVALTQPAITSNQNLTTSQTANSDKTLNSSTLESLKVTNTQNGNAVADSLSQNTGNNRVGDSTDVSKVVTLLKNNAAEVKRQSGLDVNTDEGLGKAIMQYWKENNLDPKTLKEQLPNMKKSEIDTASKALTNTNVTETTNTKQLATQQR